MGIKDDQAPDFGQDFYFGYVHPPIVYYTTPPYSLKLVDESEADGASPVRAFTFNRVLDESESLGAFMLSGELRALLKMYDHEVDETESLGATVDSGELRALLITYEHGIDETESLGATAESGELRVLLITYTKDIDETESLGASVVGGTLS